MIIYWRKNNNEIYTNQYNTQEKHKILRNCHWLTNSHPTRSFSITIDIDHDAAFPVTGQVFSFVFRLQQCQLKYFAIITIWKIKIPTKCAELKLKSGSVQNWRRTSRGGKCFQILFSVFNLSLKNETWEDCGDVPRKTLKMLTMHRKLWTNKARMQNSKEAQN